ncbi:T9SS type B sorting domain-containing protein [Hydrotalea sp.]|uniref:T9SS type B sorting domain-containing protein n=1 Tax=Hydrotalea sp. TaxID=2881279 RepID=UPI003D09BAAB
MKILKNHTAFLTLPSLLKAIFSFIGMVVFFAGNTQTFQFEKGYADFPFTYNQITVSAFGSGSYFVYDNAWSSCEVATKAGSIWLGAFGPASFTNQFSQPVNDMVYNINAADTTETFTFSVNNGNIQLNILTGCSEKWCINDNQLICKGVNAGVRIQIHSSQPFTQVNIQHNGLMDGSLVTMVLDEALEFADAHATIKVQPIPLQKICLGNTIPDIPISISGDINELSSINCSINSPNQQFISDSNILILGTNGNRSIHFTKVPTIAGNIALSLNIRDSDGLNIQVPIHIVVVEGNAKVMINTKHNLCKGETVALEGTPANGIWNINQATMSDAVPINNAGLNIQNGKLIANNVGKFQLSYTIVDSSTGCSLTTSTSIQVNDLPMNKVMATKGTLLCEGSQLPLSAPPAESYQWFRNQQPLNEKTQVIQVKTAGNYAVQIKDTNGCINPALIQLAVTGIAKPKAAFVINSYCTNLPMQLQNQSDVSQSGPVNFQWSDTRGNSSYDATPSFIYQTAGEVKIQLKITSQVCPSLISDVVKTIQIENPEQGKTLPDLSTQETAIHLQTGRVGKQYQWQPANAFVDANVPNPILNVSEGNHQYTVTVIAASGCTVTDTLAVNASANKGIYVANVFSPNSDGQNDKLQVNLIGYTRLNFFRVYDRKGRLLFQTSNVGEGWDGTVNGSLQPLDTYVWVAEAMNDKGQRIYREGSTTLLR